MTVKEFCKATGMNDKTAYRLIKKYRDGALSGHITKVPGESYDLDDYDSNGRPVSNNGVPLAGNLSSWYDNL